RYWSSDVCSSDLVLHPAFPIHFELHTLLSGRIHFGDQKRFDTIFLYAVKVILIGIKVVDFIIEHISYACIFFHLQQSGNEMQPILILMTLCPEIVKKRLYDSELIGELRHFRHIPQYD